MAVPAQRRRPLAAAAGGLGVAAAASGRTEVRVGGLRVRAAGLLGVGLDTGRVGGTNYHQIHGLAGVAIPAQRRRPLAAAGGLGVAAAASGRTEVRVGGLRVCAAGLRVHAAGLLGVGLDAGRVGETNYHQIHGLPEEGVADGTSGRLPVDAEEHQGTADVASGGLPVNAGVGRTNHALPEEGRQRVGDGAW